MCIAVDTEGEGMWMKIKRAWRWLWCDHRNTQREWGDGEGWRILACRRCGRAVVFTEGQRPESTKELP